MSSRAEVVRHEILQLSHADRCPDHHRLSRWCRCLYTTPEQDLGTHRTEWLEVVKYLYHLLWRTLLFESSHIVPDKWSYLQDLLKLLDRVDHNWIQTPTHDGIPLGVCKGIAAMHLLFDVEKSSCSHRANLIKSLSLQLKELYRVPSTALHMIPKLFDNDYEWLSAFSSVINEGTTWDVVTAFAGILAMAYSTARGLIQDGCLCLSGDHVGMLLDICGCMESLFPESDQPDMSSSMGDGLELSSSHFSHSSANSSQYTPVQVNQVQSSDGSAGQAYYAHPRPPQFPQQGVGGVMAAAQQFPYIDTAVSDGSQGVAAAHYDAALTGQSLYAPNYGVPSLPSYDNGAVYGLNGFGFAAQQPPPAAHMPSELGMLDSDWGDNFTPLLGAQIRGMPGRSPDGQPPLATAVSASSSGSLHSASSASVPVRHTPFTPGTGVGPPPLPRQEPRFSAAVDPHTPHIPGTQLTGVLIPRSQPSLHPVRPAQPAPGRQRPIFAIRRPAVRAGVPGAQNGPERTPRVDQLPPLSDRVVKHLLQHTEVPCREQSVRRPSHAVVVGTPFALAEETQRTMFQEMCGKTSRPAIGIGHQGSDDRTSSGPSTPSLPDTAVRLPSDTTASVPSTGNNTLDSPLPPPVPSLGQIPPPAAPNPAATKTYPTVHHLLPDSFQPARFPTTTPWTDLPATPASNTAAEILDTATNRQYRMQDSTPTEIPEVPNARTDHREEQQQHAKAQGSSWDSRHDQAALARGSEQGSCAPVPYPIIDEGNRRHDSLPGNREPAQSAGRPTPETAFVHHDGHSIRYHTAAQDTATLNPRPTFVNATDSVPQASNNTVVPHPQNNGVGFDDLRRLGASNSTFPASYPAGVSPTCEWEPGQAAPNNHFTEEQRGTEAKYQRSHSVGASQPDHGTHSGRALLHSPVIRPYNSLPEQAVSDRNFNAYGEDAADRRDDLLNRRVPNDSWAVSPPASAAAYDHAKVHEPFNDRLGDRGASLYAPTQGQSAYQQQPAHLFLVTPTEAVHSSTEDRQPGTWPVARDCGAPQQDVHNVTQHIDAPQPVVPLTSFESERGSYEAAAPPSQLPRQSSANRTQTGSYAVAAPPPPRPRPWQSLDSVGHGGSSPAGAPRPQGSLPARPSSAKLPWLKLMTAQQQMVMLDLLTAPASSNHASHHGVQSLPTYATVTAVVHLLDAKTADVEVQRAALRLVREWSEIPALLQHMQGQRVFNAAVSLLMHSPCPELKSSASEFVDFVKRNASGTEPPVATCRFSVAPYRHLLNLISNHGPNPPPLVSSNTHAHFPAALGSLLLLSNQGTEVKDAFANAEPRAAVYHRLVQFVLNGGAAKEAKQLAAELVSEWFECLEEEYQESVGLGLVLDKEWESLGYSLVWRKNAHTEVWRATEVHNPGNTSPNGITALVDELGSLNL